MFGRYKFITLFIVLNLILSTFYIDIWQNANTTSRALPIITFFEEGTFRIDKYHHLTVDKSYVNGHYYTDKAPLPTFYVLPIFGTAVNTGIIQSVDDGSLFGKHIYILGGIFAASIPFVIILLILISGISPTAKGISPVILVMLPVYGSFIFVFTGTFFAHVMSGLLLLLSYIYLKKGAWILSGLFAGLCFLSEYNLAVIFAVWGILIVYRQRNLKPLIYFALGVLPSLIAIGIYNYHFTGSPFNMLYKYHTFDQHSSAYGFGFPTFESLWGLSFSPYRGVFFYAPILIIFLILAFNRFKKERFGILTNNYLVSPSIVYFLFIASFFAWWGGWTIGPRFLTGIVILVLYEGIRYLAKNPLPKPIFYFLSFAGLLVIFLSKGTIAYSAPTEVYSPLFDLIIPELIKGNFNPNNVMTIVFQVKPFYSFIIYLLLFSLSLYLLTYLYPRWQKR